MRRNHEGKARSGSSRVRRGVGRISQTETSGATRSFSQPLRLHDVRAPAAALARSLTGPDLVQRHRLVVILGGAIHAGRYWALVIGFRPSGLPTIEGLMFSAISVEKMDHSQGQINAPAKPPRHAAGAPRLPGIVGPAQRLKRLHPARSTIRRTGWLLSPRRPALSVTRCGLGRFPARRA
jgi:hypothetical protein